MSTPGGTSIHVVDVADDVLDDLADVLRADVDRLARRRAPPRPTARAARCRASSTRARSRAPSPRTARPTRHRRRRRAARGSRRRRRPGRARAAPPHSRRRTRRARSCVKSWSSFACRPSYSSSTKTGSRPSGRSGTTTSAPPRSYALGVPVLAHDDHVVPGAAPLARERTRVDVRARTSEKVSVPEQDAHRRAAYAGATSGGSTARRATRPRDSTCAPSRRRASRAALRSS